MWGPSEMSPAQPPCMLGVFVGGKGQRLGGVDKSALPAPDGGGSLLERVLRLGDELLASNVIVGRSPGGRRVADDVVQLDDAPSGIGPLGGLCALLAHAGSRPAFAVACDMPYVDVTMLRLLRDAPAAAVVAPRDPDTGKWYPLFARYDSANVLPVAREAVAAGTRSFQVLFRSLDVRELELDSNQRAKLRDWDRPEDLR